MVKLANLGEVPERSNGAVSKTVVGSAHRGFESLPLRCQLNLGVPLDVHARGLKSEVGAVPMHRVDAITTVWNDQQLKTGSSRPKSTA